MWETYGSRERETQNGKETNGGSGSGVGDGT